MREVDDLAATGGRDVEAGVRAKGFYPAAHGVNPVFDQESCDAERVAPQGVDVSRERSARASSREGTQQMRSEHLCVAYSC